MIIIIITDRYHLCHDLQHLQQQIKTQPIKHASVIVEQHCLQIIPGAQHGQQVRQGSEYAEVL